MSSKPKLLILGTGWGGTSLLRALRRPFKYDITVASERDHMLFTPLLASTATGALEHRSIMEPIRPLATRKGAQFLNARATEIESEKSRVHFEVPRLATTQSLSTAHGHEVILSKNGAVTTFNEEYDGLVVSVGATVNTFGVPGVKEYALFMKEAWHARAVRKRMHDLFEAAALPVTSLHERRALLTFVVCGAGPTGVELTAEIADWLRDMARSRRYGDLVDLARVVLVEASGNILSTFDHNLRTYALSRLRAARVDIKLGATVKRVEPTAVILDDDSSSAPPDSNVLLTERLPCGMVIWTAGVGPRPVVVESDLPKIARGSHIETDCFLLCETNSPKPIFAIGDCARIQDNPLVPIAQVAEQQGTYVAGLLDNAASLTVSDLRQAANNPFEFASKGMLAYVGSARGVATVTTGRRKQEQKSTSTFRTSGFVAWMFWRFAYFSKLGSLRNKLQVPLDWTKTALFGRDVSSF